MRVLVVSNNSFNKKSNMGKTLSSYFSGFNQDELAQLYIQAEVPTDATLCTNYYRFTDVDAIKSIFNRSHTGTLFQKQDIDTSRINARIDTGAVKCIYARGSRYRTWSLFARSVAWGMSNWKNCEVLAWIDHFSPDIIFFASGDSSCMYTIAAFIANYTGKPLVVACVDDYYLHSRNEKGAVGYSLQKSFMKIVAKTMCRASSILTICDSMNKEYSALFHKTCYTLHTAANVKELKLQPQACNISYIGNVGLSRYQNLISMGEAMQNLKSPLEPSSIDVYSGSTNAYQIDPLKDAQGICFHGSIIADEVIQVMQNSMAVIHTESFDEEMKQNVRFSVSTKIADSLMYGPCIIAYGPNGIASIDYLKENGAAYVITRPEDLQSGLQEIIENAELRQQIISRARTLAKANHNNEINSKKVRQWLQAAIDEAKR